MLILTRKIDQGIVISGNIVVRVLGVERDRVKIGIAAPLDVAVLRQELLEREGKPIPEYGANDKQRDTEKRKPSHISAREEPETEDD